MDPSSRLRTWEHAERSDRPLDSEVDGYGIMAIVEDSTGPELVLLRKYRPAINKVTIEMPTGLLGPGENLQEAAAKKLECATGYTATVLDETSIITDGMYERPGSIDDGFKMFYNPGFCNTNLKMLHVKIDASFPGNGGWRGTECRRMGGEGYAIDTQVGALAEGIELAKRWKLSR
ncbi:NUDIX domain-containing protein [Phlyctema vagabunda]|uniref:NUDIX domain-containing protein n=1 Tax=Phlyctema vagabunda TaxID=108571 RepID=A0ABR4PL85_9HELO